MSGVGAPNRYTAPYTLGEGQTINISMIRSTLMASIFEPEKLKEREYFAYLQNAYEWGYANNRLHIKSKTAENAEVIMIFGL
jgi:heat shock protein HslJ